MTGPLGNPGLALILRPQPIDVDRIATLCAELGLVLRATQPRGERQFCERRFSDDAGRELSYREDHVLGLRVLIFTGPDVFELRDQLANILAHHTLPEALADAEAAEPGEGGAVARITTLGPLCALLAYDSGADLELAAYEIIYRRLHDSELSVRRAALVCAAYVLSPEVTEILLTATEDADLAVEVSRQLALRGRMTDALDYGVHLERAEIERTAGHIFAALVSAHIALALARRTGEKLHPLIALCESLTEELVQSHSGADVSLSAVQALLDLGRFHEAEEVVTALLQLDARLPDELGVPWRVSLVAMLAEALRGRGRHDLAADALHAELQRIETLNDGSANAEPLRQAQRHLASLL